LALLSELSQNLETSKGPLEIQAQGTSLFTSDI